MTRSVECGYFDDLTTWGQEGTLSEDSGGGRNANDTLRETHVGVLVVRAPRRVVGDRVMPPATAAGLLALAAGVFLAFYVVIVQTRRREVGSRIGSTMRGGSGVRLDQDGVIVIALLAVSVILMGGFDLAALLGGLAYLFRGRIG